MPNETTHFHMVWSDVLEENVNAVLGQSNVTVSYVDKITGAMTNETYRLEVLPRDLYHRYVQLGFISEELPDVIFVANNK